MARDVKVTISLAKGATSSGFGYPLIFEGKATTAIPYTECADIDEVITAVGGITSEDDADAIESKTETAKASNIYKAALLLFMQDKAPDKIAVCATKEVATTGLATILHHGWRQLVVVSTATEGEDTQSAISDYIETTEKMYFTSVADVSGATIDGNDRTVMLVHADEDTTVVFPEAALVGATAGKPAGSITYKNVTLKGLTPKILSTSEITAIHNAHAIAYTLTSGYGSTTEGMTTGGEYVDIMDAQDFVVQNVATAVQQLLIKSDKLAFDNTGISQLENAVVNVLRDAANNGIIALSDEGVPMYNVSFKPRSGTKASDRTARRYVEGAFTFSLAGAIHTVEVIGTIEI